jgi:putative SOS response-associated peptidase YedK
VCGRFSLDSDLTTLSAAFGRALTGDEPPARHNVTPGTWIPALRQADAPDALRLEPLWWGFQPEWSAVRAPQPINARAETVAGSAYFRDAFAHRRCLIPANGWYEWSSGEGRKQPWYITHRDGEILWFAGVWAARPDGRPGCAIITEPARGVAKTIHPRMPLTLNRDSLTPWLSPALSDRAAIRGQIHRLPPEQLVHSPANNRLTREPTHDADLPPHQSPP